MTESPSHFVYKLIPPRPTFAADMTPDEQAAMGAHAEYWRSLLDAGRVVVYGPVLEPTGAWGLAVFTAASADAARAVGESDPVVARGIGTFEVHPMLSAIVRG